MTLRNISATALLIALAGILMNTSIINIDETGTGIPVFYAVLPLLVLRLITNAGGFPQGEASALVSILVFACMVIVILSLVTLGHITFSNSAVYSEVKQFGARVAFLCFFLLSYLVFHKGGLRDRVKLYSMNILKVFIIYGIYQILATIYDLPRFLDFLRNSSSFGIRDLDSIEPGGWLDTYRATSVWTEPSYIALPLGYFLYLLYFQPVGRLNRIVWTTISVVFAALTFSRVVWLSVGVLLIWLWFATPFLEAGTLAGKKMFERYKYLVFLLLIVLFSISWPYVAPLYMEDVSSLGRSSSVIIGWRVFSDYPILGTGFNTYQLFEGAYSSGLVHYNPEVIVHNIFSGYVQQMGVLGLIYSVLPIVLVLSLKRIRFAERAYVAFLFTILGSFQGDFFYMPLTWLLLAVVVTDDISTRRWSTRMNTTRPLISKAPTAAGVAS